MKRCVFEVLKRNTLNVAAPQKDSVFWSDSLILGEKSFLIAFQNPYKLLLEHESVMGVGFGKVWAQNQIGQVTITVWIKVKTSFKGNSGLGSYFLLGHLRRHG